MKKYEKPAIDVFELATSDVITTSSFDGEDHIFSNDFPKI